MTKTKLSIVILSYNVRELLDNCLKSVLKDPDSKNWQIIVVDNASTDDTVNFLKRNFVREERKNKKTKQPNKGIQLIESKKNVGFSAGNNLAINEIKSEYTLFLNPDTEVPVGTIPRILQFIKEHPEVGATTCKVVLGNGKLDDGCHRGFPSPWNSFCHFSGLSKLFPNSKWFSGYSHGHKNFATIHEIDSLTGAFMMLRTKVGRKLGWWDEDYFFNAEDLDFCYRIKQAGYKIMYVPDVKIIHYKGASAGYKSSSHGAQTVSKKIKLRTAKSSTQAMKIFYEKHYVDKYPRWMTELVFWGINLLEKYRVSRIK